VENSTKVWVAGIVGLASFVLFTIMCFSPHAPNVVATVDYPSLVFKPSNFEVQFSLKNTVPDSVVENTLTIDSGEIQQLDTIPSKCEELTAEERICEESLSFKVINSTSTGTHNMKFTINSTSPLNIPIIKNFVTLSTGSTEMEIPININTPEVQRLSSQSSISHVQTSWLYKMLISFLVAVVIFGFLIGVLFIPDILSYFF
jgi:hypothetical protein